MSFVLLFSVAPFAPLLKNTCYMCNRQGADKSHRISSSLCSHDNALLYLYWYLHFMLIWPWCILSYVWWEAIKLFWIFWIYSSLESRQIPTVFELGQVMLFWKLIRSIIWQLSHRCQNGVFLKQFSIEIVKYKDGMLILGQNDIFCGHNVVHFSVWFLQLTAFKYFVTSHVTEPGSLLTEPAAVIKFSHFISHRCML